MLRYYMEMSLLVSMALFNAQTMKSQERRLNFVREERLPITIMAQRRRVDFMSTVT